MSTLSVDANNDGLPDIENVQGDGTLNVLLNPGKGNLNNIAVTSTSTSAAGSYPTVLYAQAADLNGDGYLDIIAMDQTNSAALIFMNKKDGTFANSVSFPITLESGSQFGYSGGLGNFAFGDVNGDGRVDLVIVTFSPQYSESGYATQIEQATFLGNGDGTFGAPLPEQSVTFAGLAATLPGQAQLVDMNKDGKLDFVFMAGGQDNNYQDTTLAAVLIGDGTGKFSALPTSYSDVTSLSGVSDGGGTGGFAVQDVDGDGNLDVIFDNDASDNQNGTSSVFLSLGKGDGTLGPISEVLQDLPTYPTLYHFADVTGDGLTDVVVYEEGAISVYAGQGKGAFAASPMTHIVAGFNSGDLQPAPADFDGDGKVDIASVDQTNNMAAIYLQKQGTFEGAPFVVPPGEETSNTFLIAAGDYNGDGAPDVIFGSYASESDEDQGLPPDLVVAVNDGKGNFTYKTVVPSSVLIADNVESVEPVFVDLNGDNHADIIWAVYGGLQVLLNAGDGTYGQPINIDMGDTAILCAPSLLDFGDLNGDGKVDMVAAFRGDASCGSDGSAVPGIFTFLGNGDGTFGKGAFMPLGAGDYEPKLIDLDGDGNLDLAVSDFDTDNNIFNLWTVPGKGDGTFDTNRQRQPLTNSWVVSIIPGDYDQDGKQDLTLGVAGEADANGYTVPNTTATYMLKGHGDFTFDPPQQNAPDTYATSGVYADFNGDGLPDLALALLIPDQYRYGAGVNISNLAFLPNLGNGSFGPLQQAISAIGDDNVGYLAVADLNGDGAPDVLNEAGYGIGLYLNAGAIHLGLAASATSGAQYSPVTLTATLTPSVGSQTPSGTISFYDNGTLLQALPVSGSAAELTLSDLAVGSHTLTAVYSGDAHFNVATATTPVNVAVTPLAPAFTLSAPTPGSLTLSQGATGTVVVTLAGNAAFSGTVQLSCSGAPSEASCTVAPGSVALGAGQTATAAIVVATTAKNDHYSASNTLPGWMKTAGGVSLAGMVLLFWPGRRRRRNLWMVTLLLVLGAGVMTTLSGCGDSGNKYPGTPAGNATLTVTAVSGSTTLTQTFTVTVSASN